MHNTGIYIPEGIQYHQNHHHDNGVIKKESYENSKFKYLYRPYELKGKEITFFLKIFHLEKKEYFGDETNFSDEEFKEISSVSREQFCDLFKQCRPVKHKKGYGHVNKKNLLLFLCKLRQGL